MPDRVRRATQRAIGLASLALLVFSAIGPAIVTAEESVLISRADRPIPREQKPRDTPGYRLPFASGVDVRIHQGWNSTFSHNGRHAYGYDFGLPEGTPVLAAAAGVVSWTHDGESKCGGEELRRKTNYVTIDHPDGSATHYGHLQKVGVEVGDVVRAGQQIGRAGKSGFTGCMAHLHFARQGQGAPVTNSIPVYFDAYPGKELLDESVVRAAVPACGPAKEAPIESFCATYAPLVDPTRTAGDAKPEGEGSKPVAGGSKPATAGTGSTAEQPSLTTPGPAFFSRVEQAIDFDWAVKAPGGYWLDKPAAGFAASWSGQFTFATGGTYEFQAFASDRLRVVVDGQPVIDDWSDHPESRPIAGSVQLQPGVHVIKVEHVDSTGTGALSLAWSLTLFENSRWTRFGPLV